MASIEDSKEVQFSNGLSLTGTIEDEEIIWFSI
jgi:hypothetical protein